jgi:hypothetical protein
VQQRADNDAKPQRQDNYEVARQMIHHSKPKGVKLPKLKSLQAQAKRLLRNTKGVRVSSLKKFSRRAQRK